MDDAKAFSVLYRREADALLSFLTRRTLDGETAFDLMAETFAIAMRCWGKLARLSPEQQRAWLYTVARRQFGRYLRHARVQRRAIDRLGIQLPELDRDDLLLIERRAGLGELRDVLGRELARLSPEQRDAVCMRVIDERPYEEIAAQLGVSEDAARARVSRGLRGLARALEPYQTALEGCS
jgi:RNA polymerase sigma factor (sigma-70 family)